MPRKFAELEDGVLINIDQIVFIGKETVVLTNKEYRTITPEEFIHIADTITKRFNGDSIHYNKKRSEDFRKRGKSKSSKEESTTESSMGEQTESSREQIENNLGIRKESEEWEKG